ncbi:hypothetical protein [Coleofasciculus sp. E2-BRE-01]|uniref:hypothetical protein n=1 Tax=Coleofasciculus sp. E2-BRE-01 TaxID=3069524 RepID=UPI0032F8AC53
MNIWIITIGNSDVQLWTKDHWTNLYRTVRSQLGDRGFTPTEGTDDRFLVPGRVMGTVYGQSQAQDYWHDLAFPLLDNFVGLVQHENIKIDQIILILTDQEVVFSRSQRRSTQSAYWQDTCTLEPIVATYLKDKLPQAQLKSLLLQPQSPTEGLDDWDSVLKLIQSELAQLDFPDSATIYVSHQASTPAISSAVQFMSLARFGKRVQFLVSNEYNLERPANVIGNSQYLRGIQVQQVKGLIQSGTPGAALHLLEFAELKGSLEASVVAELEKLVDFFNLNRSLTDKSSEFDVQAATARIVDGIALIERLFEQKNYLPGIALLAAAQETFLRCAITTEIKGRSVSLSINGTQQSFPAADLIQWLRRGLQFVSTDDLKHYWSVSGSSKEAVNQTIKTLKLETLKQLQFPIDDNRFKRQPNQIGKNEFMLKWLCHLRSDFQPWELLQWSCIKKNEEEEYEDDIRNKLMHNLQGVKPEDVVKYLLGNQKSPDTSVIQVYQTQIKPQFIAAIHLWGLPFTEPKLAERLQGLADGIRIQSTYDK